MHWERKALDTFVRLENDSVMPRLILRVSIAILFVAFLLTTIINLLFIPRGVHLAKFVLGSSDAMTVGARHGGNWIDRITFEPLSKAIFRHTGNYCDAPHYSESGQFVAGENMILAMLVAAISDASPTKRRSAQNELRAALLRCDPNVVSSDQPISPLHSAILFRDSETVLTLLKSGARPSIRAVRPGKAIDGMDALEFALHLKSKAKDRDTQHAYAEIAVLISQHNETLAKVRK